MTFKIGPDVLSNNEIELRENSNGNLEVVSKGNGEILTVDESASLSDKIESTLSDNLDANGNDLNNVGTANANSVKTEALETDWLVDVGNHDTLQDAIDVAESSTARMVKIPPGTYNESVKNVNEPLVISGCGKDTIIDGGAEQAFATNVASVVENLSLTSDGDNALRIGANAEGALFSNLSILGAGNNGVDMSSGASSLKFEGFDVSPCDNDEMQIAGDNISVIGCIVEGQIVDSGNNNSIPANGAGNVII